MAIKTTYENNFRLHWEYTNGKIINRNNNMWLMEMTFGNVNLGEEDENCIFKFVDIPDDDYEVIESQKTKKVLEALGRQGSGVTFEKQNKSEDVKRQDIWLREPVSGIYERRFDRWAGNQNWRYK